jgi:hypothetical protein
LASQTHLIIHYNQNGRWDVAVDCFLFEDPILVSNYAVSIIPSIEKDRSIAFDKKGINKNAMIISIFLIIFRRLATKGIGFGQEK